MVIIRSGLKQLFKCAFGYADFYEIVFNPEMINLLFDNDKTISPQFNATDPHVVFINNKFDEILKFALNHLANSMFTINLYKVNNVEQYTDILFNILTNEGNKFPKIVLRSFGLPRLYDLIIEYIATSKDCSKMISTIFAYPEFELNKKAENVEIDNKLKIIKYQIANIYNPKVRFSFKNWSSSTCIRRI
uniref:Uncharacterized protein n=1 Tax=Meloidogyne enterolobii TaxID=390850 RepID=A0A6V7YAD1_MELEN|nr:unnamed protein product [Meloidogyne enterolobii]